MGSTGAGKTTITNLINRFYEIESGLITYDGIDVREISKESPAASVMDPSAARLVWTRVTLPSSTSGVVSMTSNTRSAPAMAAQRNEAYRQSATNAQSFAGAMMPAMGNISHINYALTCCVGALLSIAIGLDLGALLGSGLRVEGDTVEDGLPRHIAELNVLEPHVAPQGYQTPVRPLPGPAVAAARPPDEPAGEQPPGRHRRRGAGGLVIVVLPAPVEPTKAIFWPGFA